MLLEPLAGHEEHEMQPALGGASGQTVRATEFGVSFGHRRLGPPVRWRAAHHRLFSDGPKFFKRSSSTLHSGTLAE
jgi:hypothetical protein